MPHFEVHRQYSQMAEIEVGDKVRVKADSKKEAAEKAKDGEGTLVDYTTGHSKWREKTTDPEIQVVSEPNPA